MFIARNMITGFLAGEPVGDGPFAWPDGARCDVPVHGLPYYGGASGNTVIYQLYEIVELDPSGAGSLDTVGEPTYESGKDRVTRTHTLSDPRTVAAVLAVRLDALASHRWQREVGGFSFNGLTVPSDDRDKLFIKTAHDEALADAGYTKSWKVAPGVYLSLDATTLIALGAALLAHVSACFANEETHALALVAIAEGEGSDAAKKVALDAYDISGGW